MDDLEVWALRISCKVGALPSYLGLSLGVPDESVAVWDVGRKGFGKDNLFLEEESLSLGAPCPTLLITLCLCFV